MMNWKLALISAAAGLGLVACTEAGGEAMARAERDAQAALAVADADAFMDKPVDRAGLAAMPGLDGALRANAEASRAAVASELRDPTSPLWGETWTVDLLAICGTVNGRNALGAYAGPQRFIVHSNRVALIEGDDDFSDQEWAARCDGPDRRMILAASEQ